MDFRKADSDKRGELVVFTEKSDERMPNILNASGNGDFSYNHHPRTGAIGSQEYIRYIEEALLCLTVQPILFYSMSDSNITKVINPSTFILHCIPGLETAHVWISIPFYTMYIIALLGNFTILCNVKMELSLQGYGCHSTFLFWFNSREIDFSACLVQLYFIHCFIIIESGILVAMALDRYVAICHPLRHSTILTSATVTKLDLAVVLRGALIILPCVLLTRQWSYCRTNMVPRPYCVHMPVVGLACGDTRASSHYGLFVLFCLSGLDVFFIVVSYIHILRAIFRLPTTDARLKTFRTCISHLCSILVFHIPGLYFSLSGRFEEKKPHPVQALITIMYYVMPPSLNPIIYGVMIKQIWGRMLHFFVHKGS
nr:olfactory receptor 52M1-like [Pelodiscus sinensis]|eukprot:XP_006110557.1 olfactory receptor 52M1-like [Pelodiscus sinensis]